MGFFGVQARFEGLEKGNVCFVDRGCRNEDRVGCVVLSALGSLVELMELTLLLPVVNVLLGLCEVGLEIALGALAAFLSLALLLFCSSSADFA